MTPHARRSAADASLLRAAALCLALAGCAGTGDYFRDAGAPPPAAPRALQDWPYREYWTGLVFNGDKIGFSHLEIAALGGTPPRYELRSEAAMRLRFLGVDKRVNLRAVDRVRADLTLEEFHYSHDIDGSALEVAGRVDGDQIAMEVTTSGTRERRQLRAEQPVYPSSALALLPVMRGLTPRSRATVAVFNGETQELAEAEQEVLGYESSPLFEGNGVKVATRMLGLETTTWIGADGRPLFELALHGVLISALEDAERAQRYLVEASLNRGDTLIDFARLRSPPIESPASVARLELRLEGIPADIAVPSEGGQACAREGERVACSVDRRLPFAQDGGSALERYRRPTLAAPSNAAEITALARSIGAGAASDNERIERILLWIDANIAKEAVDSFSALDVLRTRRAECQGHAYLFAALARAQGIPARIANGLVYLEPYGGFLYHSWNEAWIAGRGWQPVDPTFHQPVADATHLKLIEGEAYGELAPLARLIGRARLADVAVKARW